MMLLSYHDTPQKKHPFFYEASPNINELKFYKVSSPFWDCKKKIELQRLKMCLKYEREEFPTSK